MTYDGDQLNIPRRGSGAVAFTHRHDTYSPQMSRWLLEAEKEMPWHGLAAVSLSRSEYATLPSKTIADRSSFQAEQGSCSKS
ncbi:hypothetical protein HJFPF1_06100 [Paramyrothecium foliicola]|nr:hypothetical protein HJFPF1_06100 [Paramyrothecium foliicola]